VTPRIFLALSWIGWLIYFFFKGLLSAVVGIFAMPYVINKNMKAKKEIDRLIEQAQALSNTGT